jgi:small subunit ribosomal protein S17e|tara:strand:- start:66 stop:260 length:195 start_codon:yes stop_codon:yes gene_type:complete
MGRIKTQLIKRTTLKLLKTHRKSFNKNFKDNKQVVQELLNFPGKKLRNVIAGYATRLVKNEKEL